MINWIFYFFGMFFRSGRQDLRLWRAERSTLLLTALWPLRLILSLVWVGTVTVVIYLAVVLPFFIWVFAGYKSGLLLYVPVVMLYVFYSNVKEKLAVQKEKKQWEEKLAAQQESTTEIDEVINEE